MGAANPYLGQRLESHTKTLMERAFPRNQLHPSHIGEGLVRVDASFSSFLRAEEKDRLEGQFKRTLLEE